MCFIRINPSAAPLNPPGAAPTLTTIYDEVATVHVSSPITSPSNSPSREPPAASKQKPKRRKRSNPFGARAAKEGVVGTEKEKKRTQTIADSLDLGGDLQIDEGTRGSRVMGVQTIADSLDLGGDLQIDEGTRGSRTMGVQTIADSLDLGGDLRIDQAERGSKVVGEGRETLGRRKTVAVEIGVGSVPPAGICAK